MSADQRSKEPRAAAASIPKWGIIMRARRFLFGDDIFISYSRREASEYALALANELSKQKLSCYLDQFGTPPGKEMPKELISSLEMSTLLVLIGSEGAAASVHVGKEIEQFLRTGRGRRGIIPITFAEPEALARIQDGSAQEDFDHTLMKAEWYPTIQGAALTVESHESLKNRQPSDRVVTRIVNAEGFNSRNKRLRQVFLTSLMALIALLATSAVSLWVLSGKAASAEASARKARVELTAAEERIQGSRDQLASLQTELDKGQEELQRTTTNLTKAQKEAEMAKDASERAKRQQQLSEERAAGAREQQIVAERQKRRATAERLAVDARRSMADHPQRSLLLAVEAIKATEQDDARVPVAEEALRHSLAQSGGHVLRGHESAVDGVAISPNNRWLVSANGTDIRLWDNAAKGSAAGVYDLQSVGNPVAFSADNRWLFTGSGKKDREYSKFTEEDKTGRLYDLNATDPASRFLILRGHNGPITSVVISPDVHWLVTASSDHDVRLWDLKAADPSAKPIALPGGKKNSATVIAISPDSHWLVTSSWDPTANRGETAATYLWDLTAENPASSTLELKGHESSVSDVAFSPDSRWLATRSGEYDTHTFRRDGTVRLWNLADPAAEPRVLGTDDEQIKAMRFSPNSRLLVTGSQPQSKSPGVSRIESTVRIWDLARPAKQPEVLPGHEGSIIKVTFSPNSDWVVAVTGDYESNRPEDGIITYLWELTPGARQPIVVRDSELKSSEKFVEVSPDSHWLITGNSGHNARVWDLRDPKAKPRLLRGHEGSISSVAFSPDNHWAITGSDDKTARLWNLIAASSVASPIVLPGESDCLFAISSDNHWLITNSRDPSYSQSAVALVWNLKAGDPAASPIILRGHTDHIGAVAISSDNRWVVTGSSDNTARLWDLAAPDPSATSIVLPGHKGVVDEVAFSPDRRWVVTGSYDGTARVWNLASPNVGLDYIELADGQEPVEGKSKAIFRVEISPDSRWLITSGDENTLARLWDLSRLDKRDPAACSIVLDQISRFAISPDSRWLVMFKKDKTIRVCNLADSDPVAMSRELRTEAGPFLQRESSPSVISPDNRWLVTCSDNDVAHVWELAATDPAAASRVLTGTEGFISGIAFSPDNHWLAIGSSIPGSYNTLCVWDFRDNASGPVFLPRRKGDISVDISNDSRWLVAVSNSLSDKTAQLWELTAKGLASAPVILPIQEDIEKAGFSHVRPDSHWLITCSRDESYRRTISLWNMRLDDLVNLACRTAGRNLNDDEWKEYFPGQKAPKTCPDR
jgi:WD40 repeat protein